MKTKKPQKIHNSIYETIGDTPLVRLQRIPKSYGVECEIIVKCEFLNPGGSSKDRIGKYMIEAAEAEGLLKKGQNIVECSSGNTGIGLSMISACKGYNSIIVIPSKKSSEKISILKVLGTELIRTPDVQVDDERSYYSVAKKIGEERENTYRIAQFLNPNNPLAHYHGTGPEIYENCGGKVDYVVMTVGTGGTITGTARRLKEFIPTVKMVGVDLKGYEMFTPEEVVKRGDNTLIEGIGYSWLPPSLDRDVVDHWHKIGDKKSFLMARRLIAEEGLLVGGSSGSAVLACMEFLIENNLHKRKDLRVICCLPDGIRNYLTGFIADEWMVEKGFMEPEALISSTDPLHGKTTADLEVSPLPLFKLESSIDDCLNAVSKGVIALPVMEEGKLKGIVTKDSLLFAIGKGECEDLSMGLKDIMTKKFVMIGFETDLSAVGRLFKFHQLVFVKKVDGEGNVVSVYAVTQVDLIRLVKKF